MIKRFEVPSCETCSSRINSIFCSLPKNELEELSIEKACNLYQRGQNVFYEGGYPNGLYCVNKGKLKVFQVGNEGKEQIIRLVKEGEVLGYRSLLSGERYRATATVMEDAVICFIPRNIFFELLQKDSALSMKVMKLLSGELKNAINKITGLAQKPVRERLAESLLILKEYFGLEKDGATINIMLSREEMANIVGTATETTIRLLSDLKKEKVIELDGKKIKITNPDKLIKIANLTD
jgi:CRP-like cAMP-binding protein